MAKIITDEKLIDELLTRGVEKIFPSKEELKKVLMGGKKIKLYCGYDPSSPSLHIGNAISINKLAQFQKLGHEVVFLIGDFTGMIGDPTDKAATRKKMTREEVLENAKNYKKQASAYLNFEGENAAVIKYNSEWSDKLTFKDLIELSSNFTLQQMINRKMFKRELAVVKCRQCDYKWPAPIQLGNIENFKSTKGLKTTCPKCGNITWLDKSKIEIEETDQLRETPIGFHELLYPLAQGYDSVMLDVDLEIGGNDQMFNMLCGRDLMKTLKNKEKFVLTMKLLADDSGKKMGKTEGNVVNLDEGPENIFGQVMAWSDGLIDLGFDLCTNVSMEEVKKIDPKNNPRDAKIRLAFEITKINHGEEKAKAAQEYFINTFSKREIPQDVAEFKIKGESKKLVEILVESGNAKSLGDARRKIEQGGVSVEEEKITDTQVLITKNYDGKVLRIGKLGFIRVVF